MACKLVMSLMSENQEGECGEDWKYQLEVKVFSEGLKGEGQISVPKHVLSSGTTQGPFGSPEPVVVYRGDCLTGLLIRLHLTAIEVDLFMNDVGKASMEFKMECPGPGTSDVTKEVDITAGVREAPLILNKDAVFTAGVRFDLICE
jgi:hypothetical protein